MQSVPLVLSPQEGSCPVPVPREPQPCRKGHRAPCVSPALGDAQTQRDRSSPRVHSPQRCLGKVASLFLLVVELSGKGSLFSQMYSLSKIIWGLTEGDLSTDLAGFWIRPLMNNFCK